MRLDAARGAAGPGRRRRALRARGQGGVRHPAQDVAPGAGAGVRRRRRARALARERIAGTLRAEALAVADFGRLSDALGRRARTRGRRTSPMPELPEVETVVRGLAPRLAGPARSRASGAAACRCGSRARSTCGGLRALRRRARVTGVRRRGKYILLDARAARAGVSIHLGMTGRLRAAARRRAARAAHARRLRRSTAATSCASSIRAASAR